MSANDTPGFCLRLPIGRALVVISVLIFLTACGDDDASGSAQLTSDALTADTASDVTSGADGVTSQTDSGPLQDAPVAGDSVASDDITTQPDGGACQGQSRPAQTCCQAGTEVGLVCQSSGWGCPSGYTLVAAGDCGATASDAGATAAADGSSDATTALAWTAFEISRGWGPCPPGQVCSEKWHLSPDGQLAIDKKGNKTTSKMTADDLLMVTTFMAQAEFSNGIIKGFKCDLPPTDIGISFTLFLAAVKHTQNVTGCVISGPLGNVAGEINGIVTKY